MFDVVRWRLFLEVQQSAPSSVRLLANTSGDRTALEKECRSILPFPSLLSQALPCLKRPSRKKKPLHYPEQKKRRINWTLRNIARSKERTGQKKSPPTSQLREKDEEEGQNFRLIFPFVFKEKPTFGGQAGNLSVSFNPCFARKMCLDFCVVFGGGN